MLLDTTFLIDLHREIRRKEPGRAFSFLEANADAPVQISVITCGEFAEGFAAENKEQCEQALSPFEVVRLSPGIAWRYGQLSKALRLEGRPIGDNDLWIAATALDQKLDLVTRDLDHFGRINGLRLLSY